MGNKNICNFVLFLFIFNIQIFNVFTAQSPTDATEYQTILALAINLDVLNYVPPTGQGPYDFCSSVLPFDVTCVTNSITELSISAFSTNNYVLKSSDFSGLKSLKKLTLFNGKLHSSFLSGTSFPNPNELYLNIYTTCCGAATPDSVSFSPMTLSNHFFSIEKQPDTSIPFSMFKSPSSRLLFFKETGSTFDVTLTFTNDLINPLHIDNLRLYSMNLPSFSKVSGAVTVELSSGYDKPSLNDKITSILGLSSIEIISIDSNIFPQNLNTLKSNGVLKSIEFDMPFNLPLSNIDLSQIIVDKLSLLNVGRSFRSSTYAMPLTLSDQIIDFTFTGGSILTFVPQLFRNVKYLDLSDNGITNDMGQWDTTSKITKLTLNNNKMFGYIDDSYCQLDLSVTNNSAVNGLVPSCFSCFFSIPEESYGGTLPKFIGTSMANLVGTLPCGSIVPKLSYSGYNVNSQRHILYISGASLGVYGIENSLNKTINDQGYRVNYFVEIPNTLIRVETNSTDPLLSSVPKIFKLQYVGPVPFPIFTLSWENVKPNVVSVDWLTDLKLIIVGTHFSYNKTDVKVTMHVGNDVNADCELSIKPTWDRIECNYKKIDQVLSNILTTVTIGGKTSQFIISHGTVNQISSCSTKDDCYYDVGHGYCNTTLNGGVGVCICNSPYIEQDNCKLPYIPCDLNCGEEFGYGKCNNQTGQCTCTDPLRNITNCYPKQCLFQCINGGVCNQYTGRCDCVFPYLIGHGNCSLINHFASAVLPSTDMGGNATFFGRFGVIHDYLYVQIGPSNCTVLFINDTMIVCNAPPGKGTAKIVIFQNKIHYVNKIMYKYISTELLVCPNNCTATTNGNCNTTTGFCDCKNDWYGYDCSLFKNVAVIGGGGKPISKPNVDNSTGETEISNENTNFQLSITSLLEIDLDGKTILEYPLQSNWNKHKNQSTTTITQDSISYVFTQTIQNGTCNITYTIDDILKDKSYQFAGFDYQIGQGSIKMTIKIENYVYTSNMNTLQLQMKSTVNSLQGDSDDCNSNQDVEIENINDGTDNQTLNFITIKKNSKVLGGRFINRIESDGRATIMSTTLISKDNTSIIVGLNLPHCIYNCYIDPDFSVLVSPDFNTDCSSSRKWVIPVAVVVSIVGAASIGTALFLILKKSTALKVQLHKLKLKRLN